MAPGAKEEERPRVSRGSPAEKPSLLCSGPLTCGSEWPPRVALLLSTGRASFMVGLWPVCKSLGDFCS